MNPKRCFEMRANALHPLDGFFAPVTTTEPVAFPSDLHMRDLIGCAQIECARQVCAARTAYEATPNPETFAPLMSALASVERINRQASVASNLVDFAALTRDLIEEAARNNAKFPEVAADGWLRVLSDRAQVIFRRVLQ